MSSRDLSGPTHISNHAHLQNRPLSTLPPLHNPNFATTTAHEPSGHDRSTANNVPDRFELFLLGDGEKKVAERVDTRVPNCSYFDFKKEDHTLGNLLNVYVGKNPAVEFHGYKVPHPLLAEFELRIQTDGTISPKDALVQCCQELIAELGKASNEFTKEYVLAKMAGDAAGGVE